MIVIYKMVMQFLLMMPSNDIDVMRGSRGVVSWTCDPVHALEQRFDFHYRRLFCFNPLGYGINCTLPYLLGWDLKQEVPCLCTRHTAHT